MRTFLVLLLLLTSVSLTYILKPEAYKVHHHANMLVMIDGKEWDFSRDIYMEEVERCNVGVDVRPTDRIHLHENKWDLIHVHIAASTWWDLFSGLGWNFGSGYLVDDYAKMYLPWKNANIYYILNGEPVTNPHNITVKSEDRLLVWYGSGTYEAVLERYFPLVSWSAKEYNDKEDPASCSANDTKNLLSPFLDIWEGFLELLPHTHAPQDAHT